MRRMDSITQAVLGAGLQGAILGRFQGRRAILYGAALATLPDLDVFVRYADPVSSMTFHRGFSHSLFILTALSIVMTLVIRRLFPKADYSARRLWLTLWLVLVTHPLLDALTAYGTQLWWPLTPTPTAWSSLFIVDPVFTIPLVLTTVAALILGIGARMTRWLRGALVFCALYIAFSLVGKTIVEHRVTQALRQDGIEATQVFSTPAPLNTLLWRVIVKDGSGDYHESFVSLFDRQAPDLTRLPLQQPLAALLGDAPEHARLQWFTDNWLRYDVAGETLVVTDLRMGMAGHHFFRFAMAERRDGQWHVIVPRNWPGLRGGEPELRLLLSRILDESVVIPLAQWDAFMTDVR